MTCCRAIQIPCNLPRFIALLAGLVVGGTALADDISVPTEVDRVTVFQAGAEVTRTGLATIPAGAHRLLIDGLPAGLDPARLELTADSQAVRLGTIQLQEIHEGDLISDEERRLQGELDELMFQRQEISDRIESANMQLQLLSSLADGSVGGQQTSIAAGDVTALLDTLSSASLEARNTIRAANRELAAKDREIEQKKFELSQVATRQRTEQSLTVAVQTEAAVTTTVALTYPVNRARWNWVYEARLDTEAGNLVLERDVAVSQATGEDWTEVALTITTARVHQNTQTPTLPSLLVDLYRPPPPRAPRLSNSADVLLAEPEVYSVEEAVPTGTFVRNNANVTATAYQVNFAIPGRVTVLADSQPRILPVDRRGLDVTLVTRAVPEMDTSAYLEARFTLENAEPLQEGVLQLYRDGTFIGRRPVPAFLPGDEVNLPFGQDERVRVEVFPEAEESRDGGTFRRTAVEDRRVRYQVTSFHNKPITLEVLGRIPVPQNQAVEVEITSQATRFDAEDVDGNRGVLLWRRQAQPGEPVIIRHYYRITYPDSERLEYR